MILFILATQLARLMATERRGDLQLTRESVSGFFKMAANCDLACLPHQPWLAAVSARMAAKALAIKRFWEC